MESKIVLGIADKIDLKLQLLHALYPYIGIERIKKIESDYFYGEGGRYKKIAKKTKHGDEVKKKSKEYVEGESLYNNLGVGDEEVLYRVDPRNISARIRHLNKKYNTDKQFSYYTVGIGLYSFIRKK